MPGARQLNEQTTAAAMVAISETLDAEGERQSGVVLSALAGVRPRARLPQGLTFWSSSLPAIAALLGCILALKVHSHVR